MPQSVLPGWVLSAYRSCYIEPIPALLWTPSASAWAVLNRAFKHPQRPQASSSITALALGVSCAAAALLYNPWRSWPKQGEGGARGSVAAPSRRQCDVPSADVPAGQWVCCRRRLPVRRRQLFGLPFPPAGFQAASMADVEANGTHSWADEPEPEASQPAALCNGGSNGAAMGGGGRGGGNGRRGPAGIAKPLRPDDSETRAIIQKLHDTSERHAPALLRQH